MARTEDNADPNLTLEDYLKASLGSVPSINRPDDQDITPEKRDNIFQTPSDEEEIPEYSLTTLDLSRPLKSSDTTNANSNIINGPGNPNRGDIIPPGPVSSSDRKFLATPAEHFTPISAELIDVETLDQAFKYTHRTHLREIKGTNGAKVVLPSYILEKRIAQGENLFDLANRATIHPRHGYNPLEIPIDEVLKPMALPYGESASLSGEMMRNAEYTALAHEVIAPGNQEWVALYHHYVRKHFPASGPRNISKSVHLSLLGKECKQYQTHLHKMAGRVPSSRCIVSIPGWLHHMLPTGWRYSFHSVVLLGTMVNPKKVRQAYAIDSLPNLAKAQDKRMISLGLWRRAFNVTIPLDTQRRVREWAIRARINDLQQAYVTLFMIGLGLPNGLYGYLNSPVEWHPVWNTLASAPLQDIAEGRGLQAIQISLRHIDLIHSTLMTYTPANKALRHQYRHYQRGRYYVAERLYEILYTVPRDRVKIHNKPTSNEDFTIRRYEPVSVNRKRFLKTLVFNALIAYRDRSWVDLEIDPARIEDPAYVEAFIDTYIDSSALDWFANTIKWFVEGYRQLQTQAFVRNAICHGNKSMHESPYTKLLQYYGGAISDVRELEKWQDAAQNREEEIIPEVNDVFGK